MFSFVKSLFGPDTDYKALLQSGAVIVDVRTPGEFDSGHIKGARNIPVDTIRARVGELKKLNKPVITCCASGARSGMAKSMLRASGIDAYNGGPWTSLQNKIR